jgi:hypothetical protein
MSHAPPLIFTTRWEAGKLLIVYRKGFMYKGVKDPILPQPPAHTNIHGAPTGCKYEEQNS